MSNDNKKNIGNERDVLKDAKNNDYGKEKGCDADCLWESGEMTDFDTTYEDGYLNPETLEDTEAGALDYDTEGYTRPFEEEGRTISQKYGNPLSKNCNEITGRCEAGESVDCCNAEDKGCCKDGVKDDCCESGEMHEWKDDQRTEDCCKDKNKQFPKDCLCESGALKVNEFCDCDHISRKEEEILLQDIDKTLLMGIQATDEVLEEVENPEFKEYLKSLEMIYSRLHEKCSDYMNTHGVESDFYGSMKQAMQRGAVKLNLATVVNDGKIANMMIKGANMGLDVIAKNLNKRPAISDVLYKLAREVEAELTKCIIDLRKFL